MFPIFFLLRLFCNFVKKVPGTHELIGVLLYQWLMNCINVKTWYWNRYILFWLVVNWSNQILSFDIDSSLMIDKLLRVWGADIRSSSKHCRCNKTLQVWLPYVITPLKKIDPLSRKSTGVKKYVRFLKSSIKKASVIYDSARAEQSERCL